MHAGQLATLRELEARLAYLRELEDRRAAVLKSIDEQGKLTPELRAAIEAVPTKQELEDLYLPFKPKRRTKGMIAREAGLEPLADQLFTDPTLDPLAEAAAFINADAGFADAHAVLDGVRDLLSERWAEDATLIGTLRDWLWAEGRLQSKLVDGKDGNHADAAKFRDYFDYAEPIRTVPSHRALAVFRGRTQEILDAKLVLDEEVVPGQPTLAEGRIALHLGWRHGKRAGDELIRKTVAWTWKVKLALSLERDLFSRLREAAEATAIKVFAENLRDLVDQVQQAMDAQPRSYELLLVDDAHGFGVLGPQGHGSLAAWSFLHLNFGRSRDSWAGDGSAGHCQPRPWPWKPRAATRRCGWCVGTAITPRA